MGTKFNDWDDKAKVFFKDMMKTYKEICPPDTIFYKNNIDAYCELYEYMCQSIVNNYKNYCKHLTKHPFTNKHCNCIKKCCKKKPQPCKDGLCNPDTGKFPVCYLKEDSKVSTGSTSCIDEGKIFSDIEEENVEFNISEEDETGIFNAGTPESFCNDPEDELCILAEREQDDYCIDMIESSETDETDDLFTLPVSEYEICSYRFQNSTANPWFQVIMKLDGGLDFNRLKNAVILSLDAFPVLGCRLVENGNLHWERINNIDEGILCSFEDSGNIDGSVKNFLEDTFNSDNDPLLKVKLIRSGQYDILGVKINSICCDGTGAKEYIQLLSDIYTDMVQEEDYSILKSYMDVIKNQKGTVAEYCIPSPELKPYRLSDTSGFIWNFPWNKKSGSSVSFATNRLSGRSMERVYQYGNLKGASVNDIILTAFYRAMFKIFKPLYGNCMNISSVVDLRNYIPSAYIQPVKNLSSGFMVRIPYKINESFESTLLKVMHETEKLRGICANTDLAAEKDIKENFNCFHNYLELISRASETNTIKPYTDGNLCIPVLYNLGPISKSAIRFGDNKVTDAYMIPPVMHKPGILLMAGSYNDVLTLSIGYHRNSVNQIYIDKLLSEIKDEIMKGCHCQRWF